MIDVDRFACEEVARWMISRGYATGHGDTIDDLLGELEWQAREAGAKEKARLGPGFGGSWSDSGD